MSEPRFIVRCTDNEGCNSDITANSPLSELAYANRDDAAYVAWLQRAAIGESYMNRGRAAPIFTTTRVS